MRCFTVLPGDVPANILSWLDPFSLLQCQTAFIISPGPIMFCVWYAKEPGRYMHSHQDVASFKRPLQAQSKYGAVHDDAFQTAYKSLGRPETDCKSYQSLLASTYALECIKDNPPQVHFLHLGLIQNRRKPLLGSPRDHCCPLDLSACPMN